MFIHESGYLCLIYQPAMLCVLLLVCFEDLINSFGTNKNIMKIGTPGYIF